MSEYITVKARIQSVELVDSVKDHMKWRADVVTENNEAMSVYIVDWDDEGMCPLVANTLQEFTYKDWVSNAGDVYHNYVKPLNNNGSKSSPRAIKRKAPNANGAVGEASKEVRIAYNMSIGADSCTVTTVAPIAKITQSVGVLKRTLAELRKQFLVAEEEEIELPDE